MREIEKCKNFPSEDGETCRTVLATMMDPSTNSNPLQSRLIKVRKAVEEVAAEALRSAEIDETVVGTTNRQIFEGENAHPNHKSYPHSAEYDEYEKEWASSAAAFQLGMTLFGDDVSEIERTVVEKLSTVERELVQLTSDIRSAGTGIGTRTAGGMRQSSNNLGDENNDGIVIMDEATMELEAKMLAGKAAFLKRCSMARTFLDQEERMALALLSSAGDASTTTGETSESGTVSSPLVESAKLLSQAEKAVDEAEAGLEMAEQQAAGQAGRGANSNKAAADLEAARRIASSLRAQVRRRRSDLKHRAAAAVDRSVGITRDGITVGAGANATNAANASNENTNKPTITTTAKTKHHDSLADAYDALGLLSSGEGLEGAMRLIYTNLYELVLEPLVADHVESSANNSIPPTITLHKSEIRGAVGSRGMVYKLEWSKKTTATTANTDNDIDAIITWSHVLDVVTSVLKFVKTYILLDRSDLCHLFGIHLFGKNPTPLAAAGGSGGASSSVSTMLKPPSVSSADDASPLLDKMVRAMWDTCLPSSSSLDVVANLPEMARTLSTRIASFERDFADMELLLVDASKAGSRGGTNIIPVLSLLSDFASNYERRFGEKRRTMILSEGRDILLKGDYHNTTTVGIDIGMKANNPASESPLDFDETDDGMSIFALPKCSVSQVASSLMALCRRTMDDAVDPRSCTPSAANTALPPQLYRTARELLDLYRAIVPAAHGSEIASVPRTAAILHNDCVFFAHNCLTLGLEYKEKFPSSGGANNTPRLRQLCTFVDLVPPFRELAERTMGCMIDRQKAQLFDVVGSRISILRDALRANESVVEWTDAETALTAGTYHLRHLAQAWRPVLSRDIYCRAMGNLVDTIFSLYLDQVMAVHDISEPASHFIGALFRNATRTLSDLFADDGAAPGASAATRSTSSEPAAIKTARASSSYFERFEAVGEFMYMSLADITTGLGEGTFRSVTGPELSKLIVAAFDDSQKRSALLRLLSSSENAI